MSSLDDAFSYVFRWHSLTDACPKCQALNGREWHDQDIFQPVLVDGQFGAVWDLNGDCSLMHGGSGTCRCKITCEVFLDLSKLEEFRDLAYFIEKART